MLNTNKEYVLTRSMTNVPSPNRTCAVQACIDACVECAYITRRSRPVRVPRSLRLSAQRCRLSAAAVDSAVDTIYTKVASPTGTARP